jgi:hypothetical protein
MAEKTTPAAATAPPTPNSAGKAGTLTKMDAVRQALAKLGRQAKPLQLQTFVKQHFGIEMTADHAKTCKAKALKERGRGKAKAAKAKPAARKPAAPKAAPRVHAAPAAPKAKAPAKANGSGVSLHDVEAVKGLIGRVGAGQLRALIDLLAH